MNGKAKVSLHWLGGTFVGALTALVAVYGLWHNEIAIVQKAAQDKDSLVARVLATEVWIADNDRNVRPLRDEFIKFTGELPGMRQDILDLKAEVHGLREELERFRRSGRGASP